MRNTGQRLRWRQRIHAHRELHENKLRKLARRMYSRAHIKDQPRNFVNDSEAGFFRKSTLQTLFGVRR